MKNTGSIYAILLFSLLFASCATQKPIVVSFPPQPPDAPPTLPAKSDNTTSSSAANAAPSTTQPSTQIPATVAPQPAPVTVPLVDYKAPDNSPAQTTVSTEKDVQQLVNTNNLQFDVKPQQDDYRGGAVVYNFVPNHIYQLFVAPLELTTIILEPGETLVAPPASGDTSNFMLTTTNGVQDGRPLQQILIKAVYAGKQTTISVNSDRRSYFFHAISYEKLFMPLVSFNYPLDMADKAKQQAAENQNKILMLGRVTDLVFAYQIIPHSVHKPSWMPDRVFNDGRKTYMSFPSASRASYAPVLFEVNEKKERVLCPYRVVGTYYIVDRVLRHAELVLDINEGNIITIVLKEE